MQSGARFSTFVYNNNTKVAKNSILINSFFGITQISYSVYYKERKKEKPHGVVLHSLQNMCRFSRYLSKIWAENMQMSRCRSAQVVAYPYMKLANLHILKLFSYVICHVMQYV